MKTMTKVVLGGAVLAGTAMAAQAATTPVPLPSTDSSELILVVHASGGTAYDLVLSQTVGNGAGSYFNTTDATAAGPSQGTAVGTVFGDGSFTLDLSSDTALSTFLAGVSGQTITWGIYGGAYSGSTPTLRGAQGASLFVSIGTQATVLPVAEAVLASTAPASTARATGPDPTIRPGDGDPGSPAGIERGNADDKHGERQAPDARTCQADRYVNAMNDTPRISGMAAGRP